MTDLDRLRFLKTPEHPCSYLPGLSASTAFVDPRTPPTRNDYTTLAHLGFRRSGAHVYRPHCGACQACIPCRVRVGDFKARRRHRRAIKANQDLTMDVMPLSFRDEQYALYSKYIAERHRDGDMYPASEEQYSSFLLTTCCETRMLCIRDASALRSVAIVDLLDDGLSAVYTFFDPDQSERSLGIFTLLQQIELTRAMRMQYLYLGYWIGESPKMSYKSEFQPLEILQRDGWIESTVRL